MFQHKTETGGAVHRAPPVPVCSGGAAPCCAPSATASRQRLRWDAALGYGGGALLAQAVPSCDQRSPAKAVSAPGHPGPDCVVPASAAHLASSLQRFEHQLHQILAVDSPPLGLQGSKAGASTPHPTLPCFPTPEIIYRSDRRTAGAIRGPKKGSRAWARHNLNGRLQPGGDDTRTDHTRAIENTCEKGLEPRRWSAHSGRHQGVRAGWLERPNMTQGACTGRRRDRWWPGPLGVLMGGSGVGRAVGRPGGQRGPALLLITAI